MTRVRTHTHLAVAVDVERRDHARALLRREVDLQMTRRGKSDITSTKLPARSSVARQTDLQTTSGGYTLSPAVSRRGPFSLARRAMIDFFWRTPQIEPVHPRTAFSRKAARRHPFCLSTHHA
jgi:hypothetical protein